MSDKGKEKNRNDKRAPKPNGPTDATQSASSSGANAAQENQGIFAIQRLYTKGITFDAPQIAQVFGKDWKPQIDINIQSSNALISSDMHEVELNVTVNGKLEDKTVFTLGIKQAGIFNIKNFNKEQLEIILGSECLKILYPYAREAITDLTSRATLPQLYLTPINFDAIYAQQKQQKNQ